MNDYLCIAAQPGIMPDVVMVLKVINLFKKYEIADSMDIDGARNHVLENFQDEIEKGRFTISFDATLQFKTFMRRIFEAQFYKVKEEKWKAADGESLSIGLVVQQSATDDMKKYHVDSNFIVFRAIFSDDCVADILPVFKKRFAASYGSFLRDIVDSVTGLMSYHFYNELPSEL